jgi:hypothetical protein
MKILELNIYRAAGETDVAMVRRRSEYRERIQSLVLNVGEVVAASGQNPAALILVVNDIEATRADLYENFCEFDDFSANPLMQWSR